LAADLNAACARCGATFHCGADDPAPCACTGLQLSPAMLASLRLRYTGCLCLNCLRELAEAAAPHPRDNGHAMRE
jgi:Cysteine-rich CWC